MSELSVPTGSELIVPTGGELIVPTGGELIVPTGGELSEPDLSLHTYPTYSHLDRDVLLAISKL